MRCSYSDYAVGQGIDNGAVDMIWLFKGMLKWSVLAFMWLASVIFATTSALLMDAISDGLSNVFGITTPYAQQKNNNLKQKTAIKKTRAKSQRLAAKMVTRNVMDAGSVFIPVGGAVVGVGFAAADVYAACELIDIQNELSETLLIPNDTSVGDELCLDAVAYVESLPDLPDVKAPQWEVPDVVTTSRDVVTDWMCRATGKC